MNKFIKRFLPISLAALMLTSAAACNADKGNENENTNTSAGIHYADIKEGDNYFIRGGNTDYTVVYPENNSSDTIRMATDELSYFYEMSTGKRIAVKTDAETEWTENAKLISLDFTDELEASGVIDDVDKSELKQTGYIIKSKGDSVFIVGGDVFGTLFGVYRFLHEQLHYEIYAADEIVIDTGVIDNKLNEYDVKDVADITFNLDGPGELRNNLTYTRRMGGNTTGDLWIPVGGSNIHNFLSTVPPEKFNNPDDPENYHPEWFAPGLTQLCLTRDVEGLSDYVTDRMLERLDEYPDAYALTFSAEDNGLWCTCETCSAMAEEYGTDTAAYIKFLNACSDKLKEKAEEHYGAAGRPRQYYIQLTAYQKTTNPPVKKDKDGNWYPCKADGTYDESVKLRDDILVQYAPIYSASYHSYDTEYNTMYDDIMSGWLSLTDKLTLWLYSFYYQTQNYPYFDFYDMQETYRYMFEHNAMAVFDEEYGSAIWGDWTRLKIYLRSKLARDVTSDVHALTDAFFTNYYKAAAGTMRELFDSYSVYYTALIEDNQFRGQGAVCDISRAELWDKGVIDSWMRLFDKAYADIEYLKDADPELYEKLEYRICLDSISLRYLSQALFGSCIYVGNGNSLTDDAARYGIII